MSNVNPYKFEQGDKFKFTNIKSLFIKNRSQVSKEAYKERSANET